MSTIGSTIYRKLNDEDSAFIDAKDIARMIRERLKQHYPDVKFSVRSKVDVIDISWTDGPYSGSVDDLVDVFSFGGFDGTIDMEYSSDKYLTPDGALHNGPSFGTEGSLGRVKSSDPVKPDGGILVKSYVKYISTQRNRSDEYLTALATRVAGMYNIPLSVSQPVWNQPLPVEHRSPGRFWLLDLMNRVESREWHDNRTK